MSKRAREALSKSADDDAVDRILDLLSEAGLAVVPVEALHEIRRRSSPVPAEFQDTVEGLQRDHRYIQAALERIGIRAAQED